MAQPVLTHELLHEPAQRAVRLIALELVQQIELARDRFVAGDPEGLHDVRVTLRRLRTWVRAFEPELRDSLRQHTRRRLTKVARATGSARDAEVMAQWIAKQAKVAPSARSGRRYALLRYEQDRDADTKKVHARLHRDLPGLLTVLRAQLSTYAGQFPVDGAVERAPMAAAVSRAVLAHAARFEQRLGAIDSVADTEEIHRARIAAKRLRYLLDPLSADASVAALHEKLEALQDTLGELHDAQHAVAELVRIVGDRAARDARLRALVRLGMSPEQNGQGTRVVFPRVRTGLLALAERARKRERKAFAAFRRAWPPGEIQQFTKTVDAVCAELAR